MNVAGRRPVRARPRTARQGFTLVELLIVISIVAILAAWALPAYTGLISRARAARALGEINTVKTAAFMYQATSGVWPADVNRGIVPPELEPYLGDGYSFVRDHYLLDWDNWTGSGGNSTGVLVGISVVTDEDHFGQALVDLVGPGAAATTIGDHFTIVLESAEDT
jgi:prepilin-type N-terminal cleavage/methylation domain-containing protein